MTEPSSSPASGPSTAAARPAPWLADAAVAVLLAAALAVLLASAVLGVRGFQLSVDGVAEVRICSTDDVSMGECQLAVLARRTAATTLLTEAGAAGLAGAVLLVAGLVRTSSVARQHRTGMRA